jgi:two-component system CheB/CheR fusion protein
VTAFFRDQEVFKALEEEVIPRLFDGRGQEASIRVWSAGCATGEEAYSLAMLLLEEAGRRPDPPQLQIFASDLHDESLLAAREGFYTGDIEIDVGEARLHRFFRRDAGGYRVRNELREIVAFAPHDLLSDPPFSRVDLVSCRNLLIYLRRDIQPEVVRLFHYALNPEGFLLLGPSERIDVREYFRPIGAKKVALFQKRNVPRREPQLPVFPLPPLSRARTGRAGGGAFLRIHPRPARRAVRAT